MVERRRQRLACLGSQRLAQRSEGRGSVPRGSAQGEAAGAQHSADQGITLAQFFDFLIARYQGDIHALTGHVLVQPIDEFNRPAKSEYGTQRIPPSEAEVDQLFIGWRDSLGGARKFLPAARDYMVASLWRRVGTRMTETLKLDIRDWRPDLGDFGKLHVRHGKGSRGPGPRADWCRPSTRRTP